MATIYRCDRCHKESISREDIRTVSLPRMSHNNRDFIRDDNDIHKELCSACVSDIYEVVKPLPKMGHP